jgi:triphosphoribosyl-dephospho-CoA synthetase
LRDEIKELIKCFRTIVNDDLRKDKISIQALRKIECTYNRTRDDYHPHFHVVVSGKRQAELLRSRWLARNPTADIKANDVRPCDGGGSMELFKYFTKLLSDGKIHARSLDIIFQAMRGLRVFQPVGIRKVSEEIDEVVSEEYSELLKDEESLWIYRESQRFADWFNMETGEALCDYEPSEWAISLRGGDFKSPTSGEP